jgi:FkbM family methyltransferase
MTALLDEPTVGARASRATLETLLATDPDAAVAKICAPVEAATRGTSGFVLAGAGTAGRWVASRLRRSGAAIHCFADNRAHVIGPEVDGVAVLSPSRAVERYGDAAFIVTVFNPGELSAQLRGLGVRRPVHWMSLMWAYAEDFLPYYDLDLPHPMIAEADDILRVFDLLDDDVSRQTLIDQVRYRLTLDPGVQGPPADIANMYAEPGICSPTPDDVYVDVGAFDGDSIATHLARTGGRARRVIAVEADPNNLPALRARIDEMPKDLARSVEIHAVAVGAEHGTATFYADGTLSSSMYALPNVTDANLLTVEMTTLDDLLANTGASYVKIDIEGAEPLALAGAKRTLATGQAVWATCLYHCPEHLWTLPLRIADSGGRYRHAIRRYAQDSWEIVHYAVPVGRSEVSR